MTTMLTHGLSTAEAISRLAATGPNALPEPAPDPLWRRFARQFESPLIYILLVALVIDLGIWTLEGAEGLAVESIAIASILLLNAGLGVYQEGTAEAALLRLKQLGASLVWVLRDGKLAHLPATQIVPGDVVRVEAGDRIPADGVLVEAQGILLDESILTGESVPVDKEVEGEVFSGTLAVRGHGYVAITRTGANSAMGRLAVMIGGIEAGKTPLEQRLGVFGTQVAKAVLVLAVAITLGGLYVEGISGIGHVLLFAVALAVAAVPEGLPAVLTLALSLGVERMAKRKAVVRRLSAVEALGSVTVIATDKTGTLTENRMFVKDLDTVDRAKALMAMVLANDADLATGAGDPLELALLEHVRTEGLDAGAIVKRHPRRDVLPFDSRHKYMRVTVDDAGGRVSFLKGAPEVLLARSDVSTAERRSWEEKADGYAREGFRVLALATRVGEGDESLEFLGLVLLWDPPRPEVPDAIRRAQAAGIRVVMITGDHPATALAVATEVGIPPSRVLTGVDLEQLSPDEVQRAVHSTNVFARVAPEHKLRLVEALQASGEVVAMTGDGVNDAPALKAADIGVAMGARGTDAAREASDIVLTDDNFATIAEAVRRGRVVFDNIKKALLFILPTNGGEAGVILIAVFAGLALPVTAAQILWVNMVTAVTLAVALGFEPAERGVMDRPPRPPGEPLITRLLLIRILYVTLLMIAVTFSVYQWEILRGSSLETARTAAVNMLVVGEIVYLFNVRHFTQHAFARDTLYGNPVAFWACVALVAMQLAFTYAPPMQQLFRTTALGAASWSLILALGLAKFLAVEAEKWVLRRLGVQRM